jgi:hypothetical protein
MLRTPAADNRHSPAGPIGLWIEGIGERPHVI